MEEVVHEGESKGRERATTVKGKDGGEKRGWGGIRRKREGRRRNA